jgi:hypothetical protein
VVLLLKLFMFKVEIGNADFAFSDVIKAAIQGIPWL